ncbi:SGNH/GDSL hydrolase family protein [Streptomyces sp. S07_1.15]|uniref:SGNH/GDSL hydrolase family protein n=1 Tax=Streptomyces sp. S07_1.15 TaxID=2873925 RepID=UPI001D136C6F|nr:SGNH/GDSL hydrolase family protein [Streptomyces sp. S07_1.15]MCC3652342.1 SGNH/GDSL hydrolase family protein [Streptomyces sp. S07_1.15]
MTLIRRLTRLSRTVRPAASAPPPAPASAAGRREPRRRRTSPVPGLRGGGLLAAATAAVLFGASGVAAADCADGADGGKSGRGATYYVSLGDSLASGYQPDAGQDTDVAYTDKLFETLKKSNPGLEHIRLGCSGETTETFIGGGKCDYPDANSQLDAALQALYEHKGSVAYVTIDIGANDIRACSGATGAIDPACMAEASRTIGTNLTEITGKLRKAGSASTQYAGMTYYNPFLAAWLLGESGQQTAKSSAAVVKAGNEAIAGVYRTADYKVADVAAAFGSDDFDTRVELPGIGSVPANVAKICELTWQCTHQDIHANAAGHELIAATFAEVLPRTAPGDDCTDPGGTPSAEPSGDGSAPGTGTDGKKPAPDGTDDGKGGGGDDGDGDKAGTAGSGEGSGPGPKGGLATAGSSSTTPIVAGAAVLVLAAGAGMVFAVRRRGGRTADSGPTDSQAG